jgi:hypothetical protein
MCRISACRYYSTGDFCESPLTLKSKVYAEQSYTICKNGVGKVAKTGQHSDDIPAKLNLPTRHNSCIKLASDLTISNVSNGK